MSLKFSPKLPPFVALAPRDESHVAPLTLEILYQRWHNHVHRWVGALGGPSMDRDDLTQEVFVSARKRLSSFDGRNEAGWLFAITKRRVIDHQRSAWFKHLFSHRDDRAIENIAQSSQADTELEQKTRQRVLYTLLENLSLKRRSVFVLFEIEGLSGEEIATLEQIPLNTVWTRLHHARRDFFALAKQYQADHLDGGDHV